MKMRNKRWAGLGLVVAAALTLSACYDDGYGYGGVSVGYGTGGYYDDYYGYPYYGYRYPVYGWYDGFYYPGRGYWVYDRAGHRHRWSDHHRRHWEGRKEQHRDHGNWQGRKHRDHGNWQGKPGNPQGMNRTPEGKSWRDRSWNRGQSAEGSGRSWGRGQSGEGGSRWSRGGGGDAAVQRPAPGPMGHVFRDRGRRD